MIPVKLAPTETGGDTQQCSSSRCPNDRATRETGVHRIGMWLLQTGLERNAGPTFLRKVGLAAFVYGAVQDRDVQFFCAQIECA